MTTDWQQTTLGDVVSFKGGGTPSTENVAYWNGDIPWISPKDMKSSKIEDSIDKITPEAIENSAASLIPQDAILIVVRSGILARTIPIGITTRPLAVNQDIKALCSNGGLDPRFLHYFMQMAEPDILKLVTRGATVHRLSTDSLKALKLPKPPLPEQRRIVTILNEAFVGLAAATANAEKNLSNARELFESYLNSIFAGEDESGTEVSMEEVCAISSKLVDPREAVYIDLPHVGAGNMSSRTGELSGIKTAREEGLKSGKFLFDKTMVLYSKIRPYLMKACRPEIKGLCSADVYPLAPDPAQLDRNFLFHLLMSKDFTDFAISGSDRAGMPKVNREHLFKYRFKLPGIDEQAKLAIKLDAISADVNSLEAFYNRRLTDIADLKHSILKKAFAGELTSPPTQAFKEAAE